MSDPRNQRSQSSTKGSDGVRVVVKKKSSGPWARGLTIVSILVLCGIAYLLVDTDTTDSTTPSPALVAQNANSQSAPVQAVTSIVTTSTPEVSAADATEGIVVPEGIEDESSEQSPIELHSPQLSDDLASYFRPGDPVPTGAELIEALNEAGVHTGIAAFNPPGTSPPMAGLAVPEDFELPEGFVRHHQVTDEGEPLEPILMFSPDIQYYEAAGNIPVPEDRIVTPELAPPGMPIQEMIPPKP